MLSKDLEDALQSSFLEAREECQKYVTVEHLLLALLAEASATRILKATGANLVELRNAQIHLGCQCLLRLADTGTPRQQVPKLDNFAPNA